MKETVKRHEECRRLGAATVYSLEEVGRHREPGDLWVALEGLVFDVSGYGGIHPGGARILTKHGGTDVSDVWVSMHHPRGALELAKERFLIGRLERAVASGQVDGVADECCATKHSALLHTRAQLDGSDGVIHQQNGFLRSVTRTSTSPEEWEVVMEAPLASMYLGLPIRVRLKFPEEYPSRPLRVQFASKVYHSQVDPITQIASCLPGTGVQHVLALVWAMLRHPLPEHELTWAEVVQGGWVGAFEGLHTKSREEQEAAIKQYNERQRSDRMRKFEELESYHHQRLCAITTYTRQMLHPVLFQTPFPREQQQRWLAPSLLTALEDGSVNAIRALLREDVPGRAFSFPLFTPDFCSLLLDELAGFESTQLKKFRPNSMNNYGVILDDMGLEGPT
jgi:ubiquitin-protein ligase